MALTEGPLDPFLCPQGPRINDFLQYVINIGPSNVYSIYSIESYYDISV